MERLERGIEWDLGKGEKSLTFKLVAFMGFAIGFLDLLFWTMTPPHIRRLFWNGKIAHTG